MKKENINNVKGKAYYLGLKAKYLNLAKEASAAGDRILSEYNLQFAEHYGRILAERFSQQMQQRQTQQQLQQQPQQAEQQQPEPQVTEQTENRVEEQPKVRRRRVIKKAVSEENTQSQVS